MIILISSRNNFDSIIPNVTETKKPALVPAFQVYHHIKSLLIVWDKERDKDRFLNLCRYLVCSLESESPKLSFVGMALKKENVLEWIKYMNDILWKCCLYLEDLKPELPQDMKDILVYLHMLVAFTSTNTWAVIRSKNMDVLKAGMNQLCANIMGNLFHKGFYLILKVNIYFL